MLSILRCWPHLLPFSVWSPHLSHLLDGSTPATLAPSLFLKPLRTSAPLHFLFLLSRTLFPPELNFSVPSDLLLPVTFRWGLPDHPVWEGEPSSPPSTPHPLFPACLLPYLAPSLSDMGHVCLFVACLPQLECATPPPSCAQQGLNE